MSFGCRSTNYEKIRYGREAPHVEDDHAFGLLVFQEFSDLLNYLNRVDYLTPFGNQFL